MAKIKESAVISSKWARRAGNASDEYLQGVQNPRVDWATATAAAEKAYEDGIQKSVARKAFGKGVKKAGSTKWQNAAIEKGPDRYRTGVQLGQAAYEEGFAPFRAAIASLNLPARGAKGDPKNIDRVRAVAEALHKKKLELEGR